MTIKEALLRADSADSGADLIPRLTNVLSQLKENADLDHSARSDLVSILDDSLELCLAMLNTSYPAELVLRRTTSILSTAQRILLHTETSRPGRHCFGAISESDQILPIVANTQEEAQAQLDTFITMGLSKNSTVIPLRLSSQYILQPREEPQEQAPEPEQQERPEEIEDVLERVARERMA